MELVISLDTGDISATTTFILDLCLVVLQVKPASDCSCHPQRRDSSARTITHLASTEYRSNRVSGEMLAANLKMVGFGRLSGFLFSAQDDGELGKCMDI